jgi:hypothetical protein
MSDRHEPGTLIGIVRNPHKLNSQLFLLNAQGGRAVIVLGTAACRTEISSVRTELEIAGVAQGSGERIGLRGGFAQGGLSKDSGFSYLISRISGTASAFSNVMEIDEPFRTLLTRAGLKHAMQVPPLCRTLG